jgi:AcrR family transcriptional regulator
VSRSAFYQYFKDLHELMETLLDILQQEIFDVAEPWLAGVGDPVTLLHKTVTGLVHVCYQRGPFLRAITDAATTDARLENAWLQFLAGFDDAATARIEADQKQGLIPDFEARPVAFALNRLNAYTLLQAFGQHPRKQPEPVREALVRIWFSTLYGSEWLGNESSDLVRK